MSQGFTKMENEVQRNGRELGRMWLYTLHFADDQVIIANDKGDLQHIP